MTVGRAKPRVDTIEASRRGAPSFRSQYPSQAVDPSTRLARCPNPGGFALCDQLTSKQTSILACLCHHTPFAVNKPVTKRFSVPSSGERLNSARKLKIATLQTEYFPKPVQNPVFSGTQEHREEFRGGFVTGSFAPASVPLRLHDDH